MIFESEEAQTAFYSLPVQEQLDIMKIYDAYVGLCTVHVSLVEDFLEVRIRINQKSKN